MIASLRGELLSKTAGRVIVDVGGVGYQVMCSQAGQGQLGEVGATVFLYVHTDVREDAITLYGFAGTEEKEMFLLLISVSGVGPKLGLNVLSGGGVRELAMAIMSEDLPRLTRLPGVGKKTAERLCLELKDKVQALAAGASPGLAASLPGDQADPHASDVISALVNLGYQPPRARQAVDSVRSRLSAEQYAAMELAELLRQALRALA
ncbi:MAG: Holliday junction branch migration protein RuvA [Deltaproteobacteria bacterium CG_4_10_14_3_um_filter_60_8]|nr:MAG: Holliday junction DNA helicase RuvA [Desulfobacterales bacterium CG2_30_60_27]PIP43824.1 MAG: Holliday junction branch migration protein RuvA [Deltaproteobacteria bacterium CG23_combo_of_CG06-09_8_20_14_all_60_8]PIY21126.1 MAG: Holliday junction branch migration protein RuvA [Deltaproteobacteria bacterium CG_4_10_14_3_um_filter_60_8]